jgi:hypothetical protein
MWIKEQKAGSRTATFVYAEDVEAHFDNEIENLESTYNAIDTEAYWKAYAYDKPEIAIELLESSSATYYWLMSDDEVPAEVIESGNQVVTIW